MGPGALSLFQSLSVAPLPSSAAPDLQRGAPLGEMKHLPQLELGSRKAHVNLHAW
jgi:hypothetical protein